MKEETEVMRVQAKDPKTVGTTGSQKRKGANPPESLRAEGRRQHRHAWISAFWAPSPLETRSLLFQVAQTTVLCCGSPRTLAQEPPCCSPEKASIVPRPCPATRWAGGAPR